MTFADVAEARWADDGGATPDAVLEQPADDTARVTVPTHFNSERDMLSYGTARNSLVGELLKDAAAHEAGHYDQIGRRFDGIERELPRGAAPPLTKLRVALSFWDGWIDARDRRWQAGGNIDKGEWPMLARRIASDLSQDHEICDARVGARFDASAGGPTAACVQTLAPPRVTNTRGETRMQQGRRFEGSVERNSATLLRDIWTRTSTSAGTSSPDGESSP